MTRSVYADFIKELKEKNLIVEVAEEIVGKKTYSVGSHLTFEECPSCGSHDGFRINEEEETFICYSSKEGDKEFHGDVIDFVRLMLGLEFQETLEYLANRVGMTVPSLSEEEIKKREEKKQILKVLTLSGDHYSARITDEVKKYLQGRGFAEDTIIRQKIGYADQPRGLFKYLKEKGCTEEEIQMAGVVTDHNFDYFNNWSPEEQEQIIKGYIIFPNLDGDHVIGLQGRAFPDGNPKYKNMRNKINLPYNYRDCSKSEVIIAEGVTDTIILKQLKYNAVGIYGAGGFKREWRHLFKNAKKVYIVLDNDDVGNANAIKTAKIIGTRAIIIQLEDVNDVNDLFIKYGEQTRDIFQGYIDKAVPIIDLLIDRINVNSPEMKEQVEEILSLLSSLDIIEVSNYYSKLSKKTKINLKDLRKKADEMLRKETTDDNSDLGIEDDPLFIKLGMDIANDILFVSQNIHRKHKTKKGKEYSSWAPMLITSERKLLPIPHKMGMENEILTIELGTSKDTLAVRNEIAEADSRWSKFGPYSITAFCEGKTEVVNIATLYNEIEKQFRKWFYTDVEEDYIICSLYTILTYFHQCFSSLPFLHINGVPGSGKSTLARLFELQCFNGMLLIEPSDAGLFRIAEARQITAIIDEKENIGSRTVAQSNPQLVGFLNSRYQKRAYIIRVNKDNFSKTDIFETFGPTILCNVHGVLDILAQRAIPIYTKEIPVSKRNLIKGSQPSLNPEFQLIRDKLYVASMQYYKKILEMNTDESLINTGVAGRDNEIFKPLFIVAKFVDSFMDTPFLEEKIKLIMADKMQLKKVIKENAPEEQIKEALRELLEAHQQNKPGGSHAFHALEIIDKINELASINQAWAKPEYIGKKLFSMGILRTNNEKMRKYVELTERDPRTMLPVFNGCPVKKKTQFYNIKYDRLSQ